MSKVTDTIGRATNSVLRRTGAKRLYDKVVPSGIRKAVSSTWRKVRKPVLTAAAIYFTAGVGAAAMGGTSLAGGFAAVNSGIAGAFGGGAAATGTATATTGATTSSAGLLSGATTGATTGATVASGAGAGAGMGAGAAAGAGTTMAAANTAASGGFFSAIKSGNYGQAAVQGAKNIGSGASKAWGAATANPGSAMLTGSILQGYGADRQQRREERLMNEARDRQTFWGMNNQGGQANLGIDQIQAPTMSQSTTLDDLIKRRREGF